MTVKKNSEPLQIPFPKKTKEIHQWLKKKNKKELQELWKCSDKVLEKSKEYIDHFDIEGPGTTAIHSFTGLFYKNLEISSLGKNEIDFLQKHLLIASAFYGALHPKDIIQKYRLDFADDPSLYQYWKEDVKTLLENDDGPIINLASKEYGEELLSRLDIQMKIITIDFFEETEVSGKIKYIQKATYSKKMRGLFLRQIAKDKITDPERIKTFEIDDYRFLKEVNHHYYFVK